MQKLEGPELEEFLTVVDRLGKKYAEEYKFGVYGRDDIMQEIARECWEAYPKWDKVRSLYKFMLAVIHTRMQNLKRDKWYRPTSPCKKCDKCKEGQTRHRDGKYCKKFLKWKIRNNTKCNLAAPPSIDENYDKLIEIPPDFDMVSEELIALIDERMPVNMRETYLKIKNGVAVREVDRQVVLNFLHQFLEEYN